ncbi:hypothetical protein SDC9_187252 [bioreactor metagenome]|uniref:Uncharacterized protein n=1 Tax=bioreactor metagenome TaxID=1076179 RepID=A0A645HWL6_9ZZZZ
MQRDGCGRQRQPQRTHQAHAPRQPERPGHRPQQRRAAQHLCAAQTKDGPAHAPKAAGLQFKADQKQHQHHAEFGKVKNVLHIAHQPQPPRADGDARRQIADDGAQPERAGNGHGDHGRRQIGEAVGEPDGRVGHGPFVAVVVVVWLGMASATGWQIVTSAHSLATMNFVAP